MKKIENILYKGGWRSDIKRDCLPGTRTDFSDYITDWVNNPDSKLGLVSIPAGGCQGVIYCLRDCTMLSGHEPPHLILHLSPGGAIQTRGLSLLHSLVQDLSSRYPSFKTALGKGIRDNKRLRTAQDYHTLFEYLLLQPLRDVHIIGPILIIIDALDESGDATRMDYTLFLLND